MRFDRLLIAVVPLLVGLGCSKSTPSFSVLDQTRIPQPTFGGKSEKTLVVAGLGLPTALHGECDARIRAITAVITSVTSRGPLDSISEGTPNLACAATGTFSFTLKALDQLIPSAQANQVFRIELRADTMGGISDPTILTVTYVREDAERWHLTSGGSESGASPRGLATTPARFKADLRITHFVNAIDAASNPLQTMGTSAHFHLRYGRARQAR